VPTYDLPGNFGVRVLETMPTDSRTVFIDQLNNMQLAYKCDDRYVAVPQIMDKPDKNDYLTDEDSDDAKDFELKVPDLNELITQFEGEDDIIQNHYQGINDYAANEIKKGFVAQRRHDLKQFKGEKIAMLDKNITNQREK
jgi:hypothetical protein